MTKVIHSQNGSNTPTFMLVIFIVINSNKDNHPTLIIIPAMKHMSNARLMKNEVGRFVSGLALNISFQSVSDWEGVVFLHAWFRE